MKILKLAYKNLIGAGLRTWLNVFVLALVYIFIIWNKGFLDGWDRQAKHDTIAWEIGGGQIWHEKYDPYDAFTLDESHAVISNEIQMAIDSNKLLPVLIDQATIYPEGRLQTVMMKGISPKQEIVNIPTQKLDTVINEIPAVIGKRLAKSCNLKIDDIVLIRWRDVNGTFDATELRIVDIFSCDVPAVDAGQVYISLNTVQKMLQLPNEATMFIKSVDDVVANDYEGWVNKGYDVLLAQIEEVIKMKSVGGSVFYFILLLLALLAIFDTQVLTIFRRQKEIGTMVALGMTKREVVALFTFEGAMNAILAAIMATIIGIPFFWWQTKVGFPMPEGSDDYGMAMSNVIYPVYGAGLIIGTVVLIFVITTIVSFLPSRKISKMNPTDAIRGKIQ